MFGIISLIIALKKGHSKFAAVVGIWTAIAFLLALTGNSRYSFAPGSIFLITAITMKNLNKENKSSEKENCAQSDIITDNDRTLNVLSENKETAEFQSDISTKKCANCGSTNSTGNIFCIYCGCKLD